MDAKKLHGFIWNGIKTEDKGESLELTLPFPLCDDGEGFTVIWRRIKSPDRSRKPLRKLRAQGYTVETGRDLPNYEISDGGRILAALEKRVGNLAPYERRIKDLLKRTGCFELCGGRIIKTEYAAFSSHYHEKTLNELLHLAALITSLDILPYTAEDLERGDVNA